MNADPLQINAPIVNSRTVYKRGAYLKEQYLHLCAKCLAALYFRYNSFSVCFHQNWRNEHEGFTAARRPFVENSLLTDGVLYRTKYCSGILKRLLTSMTKFL